jgi:CRISPR-associated protein Cas5d
MNAMTALTVKVQGEFALFTRPEFSAERVSYTVMTPSAARGILESIFWKPEIRWRVEKILVLNPIRQFSILRNEINTLQSDRAAKSWQDPGGGYFAEDDRAQRHSLCLRDVAYIIQAQIDLKPHATDDVAKYRDQFRRRVERGQCFNQPYLGTREFSAPFMPVTGDELIEGVRVERSLALWSHRYGLTGIADVVEFLADGTPYPVEYKAGGREADNIQLCAQAMCLEEMLGMAVPRGAIFHHRSRRRREVVLDQALRSRVVEIVAAIRGRLGETQIPAPVADERCHDCSLKEACLPAAIAGFGRLGWDPFAVSDDIGRED